MMMKISLSISSYTPGNRRGRRPSGLRGRDIGMFYAARSKAKKERRELEEVTSDYF